MSEYRRGRWKRETSIACSPWLVLFLSLPAPALAPGVFNHACDTWIIGEANGQHWNYSGTSTAGRRGAAIQQ